MVGMILFICAPSPPKDAGEGYNGRDHTVRRWFVKGISFSNMAIFAIQPLSYSVTPNAQARGLVSRE